MATPRVRGQNVTRWCHTWVLSNCWTLATRAYPTKGRIACRRVNTATAAGLSPQRLVSTGRGTGQQFWAGASHSSQVCQANLGKHGERGACVSAGHGGQ